MKQFVYSPESIGRRDWFPGILRLEGIEVTTDPSEADIFVCPESLRNLGPNCDLRSFPHMAGYENRHVFFDVSDDEQLYGMPCLFIRCNVRPWYLAQDPNCISFAWPVQDLPECIDLPTDGFKYDVSFHGWVTSHETRGISTQSFINSTQSLQYDFACYNDFFGYLKAEDDEFKRRSSEYRRSLRESRIALCPESISGVFPYRFFEALSAARVPLLIGDDFVFPWADRIPYQTFCILCPRESASCADLIAKDFIRRNTDSKIEQMGKTGRLYWERYLNAAYWPRLMAEAVTERMNPICTSL